MELLKFSLCLQELCARDVKLTSGGMRQAAQVAQEARSCRRLDTLDIHPQVLGHLLAEQLHTGADLDVEVPISNVLTGRLEQKKFT